MFSKTCTILEAAAGLKADVAYYNFAVVLIVGALTYVPALALGPIVEHLILFK